MRLCIDLFAGLLTWPPWKSQRYALSLVYLTDRWFEAASTNFKIELPDQGKSSHISSRPRLVCVC